MPNSWNAGRKYFPGNLLFSVVSCHFGNSKIVMPRHLESYCRQCWNLSSNLLILHILEFHTSVEFSLTGIVGLGGPVCHSSLHILDIFSIKDIFYYYHELGNGGCVDERVYAAIDLKQQASYPYKDNLNI